jgi:hypothetical protein
MEHIRSQFTTLVSYLQGEVGKLQDESKNVAKELESLTKEFEQLSVAPYKIQTARVKLDVGGFWYSTTVKTLTAVSDSLLGRMFRYPIEFTEDGRVFIDRDGTQFRHILNFLRDPAKWNVEQKDKQLIDELRTEARYYGLEDAMFRKNSGGPTTPEWLDGKVRVAKFSSQYHSCPATNVLDSQKPYWLSDTGLVQDQWIVFEFETEAVVSKVSIQVDKFECTVKDFVVQISEGDDKTTWVDVMSFQAKCGKECHKEQHFEGFEVRAKYIRLFFKNNWGPGGGNYMLVTNVRFFGAEL